MTSKQQTRINVFRAQSHQANNQWQSCDEYLLHLIRMKNKDLKNRIANLQNLLYNAPRKEK